MGSQEQISEGSMVNRSMLEGGAKNKVAASNTTLSITGASGSRIYDSTVIGNVLGDVINNHHNTANLNLSIHGLKEGTENEHGVTDDSCEPKQKHLAQRTSMLEISLNVNVTVPREVGDRVRPLTEERSEFAIHADSSKESMLLFIPENDKTQAGTQEEGGLSRYVPTIDLDYNANLDGICTNNDTSREYDRDAPSDHEQRPTESQLRMKETEESCADIPLASKLKASCAYNVTDSGTPERRNLLATNGPDGEVLSKSCNPRSTISSVPSVGAVPKFGHQKRVDTTSRHGASFHQQECDESCFTDMIHRRQMPPDADVHEKHSVEINDFLKQAKSFPEPLSSLIEQNLLTLHKLSSMCNNEELKDISKFLRECFNPDKCHELLIDKQHPNRAYYTKCPVNRDIICFKMKQNMATLIKVAQLNPDKMSNIADYLDSILLQDEDISGHGPANGIAGLVGRVFFLLEACL
ncbi:uncharacterized protein LOC124152711 [Haliotis rufescens]|uniref:uncharacterized protein LOC124152711 n=1 Tax=Haliotis rufescens TaxID=6454 RepID=UPI00201EA43D|nr:uncharacterized protein LOC124152711 [Haliotis rufescens]